MIDGRWSRRRKKRKEAVEIDNIYESHIVNLFEKMKVKGSICCAIVHLLAAMLHEQTTDLKQEKKEERNNQMKKEREIDKKEKKQYVNLCL